MKKTAVKILSALLMLSMVFSSNVFAAEKTNSAWDSFLGLFSGNVTTAADTQIDGITYRTHIQNDGWAQGWVSDGYTSGSEGRSLRLEGIEIKIAGSNLPAGIGVTYRTQIENEGWLPWETNGDTSGSVGKGLRLEGIEIKLTGDKASDYSVRYKTHIQNKGWETDWAYDGALSGTVGEWLRLEGIQIEIVQKEASLTAYNAALAAVTKADYTAASWTAYQAVVTANPAATTDLQSKVDAATAAITAAQANLVLVPKVTSVTAMNASELVVTFNTPINAATVLNSADNKLLAATFKIDNAAIGATDVLAKLSTDGKTLTIYADTAKALPNVPDSWEGAHSIEILANKVKSVSNEYLATTIQSFIGTTDTTRAAIVSTESVDKYTVRVNFSKPVTAASAANVSAVYTDGTTTAITAPTVVVATDKKSATYQFAAGTIVNKEITLKFAGLVDFANTANTSVPLTAKYTISDADKTAPTIVSVTAKSTTTLEVVVSEKVALASIDSTQLTFNGVALAANKATLDTTKTNTILTVTIPTATTTTGVFAILAPTAGPTQAFTDLSGNQVAAYSTSVMFNTDTTAPVITKSEVTTSTAVGNPNQLVLTFSENVTKVGIADLVVKYTDQYGVAQSTLVEATKLVQDTTNLNVYYLELTAKGGSTAFVDGTKYTLELPLGYVVDGFANKLAATTVAFTNSSGSTVVKLPAPTVAADTAVNRLAAKGAYVDVVFTQAVDVATATTASNYIVEGATVKSVELTVNNPATPAASVRVFLTDGTVEETGTYNVTVSGVKGYTTAFATMDQAVIPTAINENVLPTITKSAITAYDSVANTTTVALTWSKTITTRTGSLDVYVDGVKSSTLTATISAAPVATVTINADLSADIAAGKVITLKSNDTTPFVASDVNGNIAPITSIAVK